MSVSQKNPASPFASLKGDHVAVRVPSLEAAKQWYVEKLDFRVVAEWPLGELRLAYLQPSVDDSFSLELLGEGAPTPKPAYNDIKASLKPAGYHHFCFAVKNVDETLAELRRRGVTVEGEPFNLEEIKRRLAYVADPWGNLIQFSETLP
jgi:lactoylglutathione lyase/glyoxylase I family protein